MSSILEGILNQTEATPISNVNGKNVYTFNDAVKVTNRELAEEKLNGKREEFGERETRENGMAYTKTKCSSVAINPENYFSNRYKKVKEEGKTIYEVVTDYRAIKEQSTGRVYTNNIIVDMVSVKAEPKGKQKIEYVGKKTISDSEFINDYKSYLNVEAMQKVASVIISSGQTSEGDSLEI